MAETSKKRSVRIPLDYYKRTDRLTWWRLALSALALLIAGGWASGLGWDFWRVSRWQERTRRLATHGPLTRSHATWDAECEACHVPFRPIGQATWAAPILGDSSRSDARCQACHAAPTHHESQKPQDLACASCHHDHKGRDASLVRMADQHCTQCHSDLTAHMKADRTPFVAATVTRFDAGRAHHPEFRSASQGDPGRLKFDHARHLSAGMAASNGGPVQTLAMLREPDRARYRQYARGPEGTIRLDCAACHQLDAAESSASAPSRRSQRSGSYMISISYENHCRACHPLDYDPAAPSLVMGHPLQPSEVHDALWKTYAAGLLAEDPALLDRRIPPRPLPGRDASESEDDRKARELIERKVVDGEKVLFGAKKCGECHDYESDRGVPLESLGHWDPEHPARITPTNVPAVWWRSAAFDHSAHRGVGCRECHERAYALEGLGASHQSKDVLLPTIAQCLECHAPRGHGSGSGSDSVRGGAGFDCTECHRYHDGDAALLGVAATPGAPKTRATIEQFLRGTPASGRP